MDSQYLTRQRDLLRKRYERLCNCDPLQVHTSLLQFWNYLHAQPLLAGVLAKLKTEAPPFIEELKSLFDEELLPAFAYEHEATGFALRVLEHCVAQPARPYGDTQPEVDISVRQAGGKLKESIDWFCRSYVTPVFDFIYESLDQQAAVLSLLVKYKRKVEWFERRSLLALSTKGERELASHLYAYLHDQGMVFHIEPQSASGEADLVSPDLVLDAKVFDGAGRGKPYIKNGVHQLLTYARDFNQSVGYLVIYRTCPEDVQFTFVEESMLVPSVSFDGRTLYLLVIDLCAYAASASKRGALKSYLISAEELREELREATERPRGQSGAG